MTEAAIPDCYDDDDATSFLERRWFAAAAKVKTMQQECEVLREVMLLAEEAFRGARVRLAELEALRDGLGWQLANPSGTQQGRSELGGSRDTRSAA